MEYTFLDFLTLIGSVGLFLYGMKVMSEGLQKVAGDRLRNILAVMTKNRFSGMLTGILITALLLTWIALLTADILHRWTKSKLTLPLALFPVAALFFLHYNVPHLIFPILLICLNPTFPAGVFLIYLLLSVFNPPHLFLLFTPVLHKSRNILDIIIHKQQLFVL